MPRDLHEMIGDYNIMLEHTMGALYHLRTASMWSECEADIMFGSIDKSFKQAEKHLSKIRLALETKITRLNKKENK